MSLHPVILAGGSGARLWPLSRESMPKQLLPLMSEHTLLQEAVLRAARVCGNKPVVICNEEHRFLVADQLRLIDVEGGGIVLEPVARNTASAAVVAALLVQLKEESGVVVLLPSDNFIGDEAIFAESVERAARAAQLGYITTFGVEPTRPETGYGYIRMGEAIEGGDGCCKVAKFVEKPDAEAADRLLAHGGNLWNSGMFAFRPDVLLEECARFEPNILRAAREALKDSQHDLDFIRLERKAYSTAPSISLDYAVMERTDKAAVCPLNAPWGDLGSWNAIWEATPRDSDDNVTHGDVLLEDTHRSLVRSDDHLTAVIGLNDVVVVTSSDAVLVAAKDRAQDIRKIVTRLREAGRREHRDNLTTYRPWGRFHEIEQGDRYQVKLITIKPGAAISLQMHHHRAEHWVVVRGTARVTRGEESFLLQENESTFIPLGTRHRLENPGLIPLEIIEVQSGAYLGEDDIVRFEDRYGRAPG
jgi:mannose-1-phosphate guanylyltransferase/mannose-6-phosphate isomerase